MTKLKIGIALGSGGARGWCHIGALRALAEEGIEPSIVAGCSMGALVGAAYVAGALDALEEFARSLTWPKIAGFFDVNPASGGLIEGKRIVSLLRTLKEDALIESLAKPFTAIASDLGTGREIWLQNGSIIDAVRASIAIPGIISPLNLNGRWLLDGGMTNPVPVSACRAMGADIIIAVNPNAGVFGAHPPRDIAKPAQSASEPPLSPDILDKLFASIPDGISRGLKAITPGFLGSEGGPGYFNVLSTSIDIMTSQILRSRLAGEPPHVMITPRLSHLSVLEFNRAGEAIEEGRQRAKKAMPLLHEYLA
ncbi:MAG: patatin-like phospholipase family protein [Rhodomicrobium sp.]